MPADEVDASSNEDSSKDRREVASEAGRRAAWSSADKRSLAISFGATLAANIATVLVVGIALVIAHTSRQVPTRYLVEWTVLAVVGLPIFMLGLLLRVIMGGSKYISLLLVPLMAITLIIVILIWIGRAAELH
jgi:hypothetical protein